MSSIPSDQDLALLTEQVSNALHKRQLCLATAESCTGGWVAKLITDIVGSSAWFERGFVTYTNESKQQMLGVEPAIIHEQGAVSEETVRAMASGALTYSQAHFSLAITGIAGPGGGTPFKPVGLVWFAWAQRQDDGMVVATQQQIFSGERDAIRRQAVAHALQGLLELLHG